MMIFYSLAINAMHTTDDMIQSFSVKKLTNASFGAFMEAFDKLITEATIEKLGISSESYQIFKQGIASLIDANLQLRKHPLSAELSSLDQRRDSLIKYFFDRVWVEKTSPVEATNKAANQLWELSRLYNGIQRKSFREESHLINGFLNDTKKADTLIQVKALGLEPVIQLL